MSSFVHQPRYTMALTAADVGERVMLRYALRPALVTPGGPRLTDVVGDLVAWSDGMLAVQTRTGAVSVAQGDVVAGKRVPSPRLSHAVDASVGELHRMSSLSWQALETAKLGGWRLRAGGGFTGRANSVLPLGDPGVPLDEAIGRVRRWYADRGLVPRFQLPQPDTDALADELGRRGWRTYDLTDVLVGDVTDLLELLGGPRPELPPVVVADAPDAGWLGSYHYRGGPLPAAGLALLTHHSDAGFASVTGDGGVLAIARGAVDERWLGIQAVEVAVSARRRGLGRHVMAGLLRWARDNGARHAQLQVAADNQPGHALYEAMGFTRHHQYRYAVPQ